jgi:RHS repeat-associated protein
LAAHPGSVVALVRADRIGTSAQAQAVTGRFRYDPYGNVTLKSGSSDTPWRFAGAFFERFPSTDANSQRGLYKMGERFYDPRIGRWTQTDPIDQSTDLREANKYLYAAADPVNLSDPSGAFSVDRVVAEAGAGAVMGAVGGLVVGSPLGLGAMATMALAGAGEGFLAGAATGTLREVGVSDQIVDTLGMTFSSARIIGGVGRNVVRAIERS